MIELWLGAKLLSVGPANVERPDVQADGIGDGYNGFAIRLPPMEAQDELVTITAKFAGAALPFGSLSVRLDRRRLSGVIKSVSGLTLKAFLTSDAVLGDWTPIEVLADGERIAIVDVPPLPRGGTFRMTAALPLSLADGAPHWFRLTKADSGMVVADDVVRTDVVATPEEALQKYARSFPGYLSGNAARRYDALARQTALAPNILARQAPGPDRLSLEAYLAQLGVAHAQVLRGVMEQKAKPAPLTALRFEAPQVSIVIPAHNKFCGDLQLSGGAPAVAQRGDLRDYHRRRRLHRSDNQTSGDREEHRLSPQ